MRRCIALAAVVGLFGAADAQATPTQTQIPLIAGQGGVGRTLTVASQGIWTDTTGPTTLTDQWEDCPDTTGIGCTVNAIQPSPGLPYPVTSTDVGHYIDVLETAVGPGVPPDSATAHSNLIGPIVGAPLDNVAPTIAGTAQQGGSLSADPGTWTPSTPQSTFAYTWLRCRATCGPSPTSTNSSQYTPTAGDVGAQIEVTVTATDASTTSTTVTSAPSAVVVPPTPAPSGPPAISGFPVPGQLLTVTQATWSNSPSTITDTWQRCTGSVCTPTGYTGTTYPVTGADLGATLKVVETASNGTVGQATSNPTITVRDPSMTAVQVSPSDPVAAEMITLVGTVTATDGRQAPSGSLTFFAGARPVPHCAGLSVRPSAQSVTIACQTFLLAPTGISAAFTPSAGSLVDGSSSSSIAVPVGRASTTTALNAPSGVTVGSRVTYAAIVTAPGRAAGTPMPTGTVAFLDHGSPISGCGAKALQQGGASCTVTLGSTTTHQISARYSGSGVFLASSSPGQSLMVTRKGPTGFITAYLAWSFRFTPSYTSVSSLQASQLSPNSRIVVVCHGSGCPFAQRSQAVSRRCIAHHHPRCFTPTAINLTSIFHGHRLHRGARFTVSITHPGWLGKYYRFAVQSRKQPVIAVGCLGVGATGPGAGCTGA